MCIFLFVFLEVDGKIGRGWEDRAWRECFKPRV